MSGAIHHYRQTLRMLPEHPLALHYLLIPECHAKFNLEQENQETDLVRVARFPLFKPSIVRVLLPTIVRSTGNPGAKIRYLLHPPRL